MIENFIILLLISILFVLGLQKKINGLYIIIFIIPYQGIFTKGVDLSILLIVAYFLGYIYNNKTFSIRTLPYKKYIIFLILIFIISIGVFIFKGQNSDFLLVDGWTVEYALLRYINLFIASILLFILINNIVHNYKQIRKCLLSFTLSIFYYSVTWLFDFILNLDIPSFLKPIYAGGDRNFYIVSTFGGYNGESCLTAEYTLFILFFSFYLFLSSKNQNSKVYYLFTMVISVIIAISTFNKSYYFALALSMFLVIYVFLKLKGVSANKKFYIFGFVIIVLGFVYWEASTSYIVKRFDDHVARTQSIGRTQYKLDVLIHRPYMHEVSNFWEVCGLIGIGPINALGVRGNHLATHSHYFDLFMKFGLIGLFIYLLFYFRLLKDLLNFIKKDYKTLIINKQLAVILFALFFSLLFVEFTSSYQNQTNYMLSYWFLFAIIASITKRKIVFK